MNTENKLVLVILLAEVLNLPFPRSDVFMAK